MAAESPSARFKNGGQFPKMGRTGTCLPPVYDPHPSQPNHMLAHHSHSLAPSAKRVRRLLAGLVLSGSAAAASPASAAGNAQVVNDAAVETPGVCHVESWASAETHGDGLVNLAIGCTPRSTDWLELDLGTQRTWSDGTRDTTLTPGFKIAAATLSETVSVALAGSVTWGLSDGHAETVNITVPVSFQLNPALQLNLNAGWEWNRDGVEHRAVLGGQVMWAASSELSLMAEGFGCTDGIVGYQLGARWTPVEWLDIDLLAGHVLNLRGTAVTLGVTARL